GGQNFFCIGRSAIPLEPAAASRCCRPSCRRHGVYSDRFMQPTRPSKRTLIVVTYAASLTNRRLTAGSLLAARLPADGQSRYAKCSGLPAHLLAKGAEFGVPPVANWP